LIAEIFYKPPDQQQQPFFFIPEAIASSNLPKSTMNNNFKLKLLATNWV
jgi:hypothetical protein